MSSDVFHSQSRQRYGAFEQRSLLRSARRLTAAFTLVEVMITTVLTLVLVAALAQVFGYVSDNVTDTRAVVEMTDRLRNVKHRLQADLAGITAPMTPPLDPRAGHGYFELIEGEIGASSLPSGTTDPRTSEDIDDILMFTSRNEEEPFRGLFNGDPITHPVAEVCWFLRGSTLHRRVLLVAPFPEYNVMDLQNTYVMAKDFDVSMRNVGSVFDRTSLPLDTGTLQPIGALNPTGQNNFKTGFAMFNTLSDLTKRENRYGHQPHAFPHDARFWSVMGLPTLADCRFYSTSTTNYGTIKDCWPFPMYDPPITTTDFNQTTNRQGTRIEYWQGGSWFSDGFTSPVTGSQVFSGAPFRGVRTFVWALALPTTYDPYDVIIAPNIGGVGSAAALGTAMPTNPIPGSVSAGKLFVYERAIDIWDMTGGLPGAITHSDGSNLQMRLRTPSTTATGTDSTNTTALCNSKMITGYNWTNSAEPTDIVMTDVVSFDVKVWDPGAPIFRSPNSGEFPVMQGDWAPVEPPLTTTAYNWGYNVGGTGASPNMLSRFVSSPTGQFTQPVGFGSYVDLGYLSGYMSGSTNYYEKLETFENYLGVPTGSLPRPLFGSVGNYGDFTLTNNTYSGQKPPLSPPPGLAQIYDTWSTHYETNGIDDNRNGVIDEGANGVDDGGDNKGFDNLELEAPPPYPHRLRGIQIKIRAIEKYSKQVREVTLYQEFPGE